MRFSIVIIGLNEGEKLGRALTGALAAASVLDEEAEVVYSDAGSTDGSVELAESRGATVVTSPGGRLSAAEARNAGWRAAKGSWVQFVDGDMGLDSMWLPSILSSLASDELGAIGGQLTERNLRGSVWNLVFGLDWANESSDQALLGGAALWRREALEALAGFDERLRVGEDPELCLRAREAGWTVRRVAIPMVDHDLDLDNFVAYWRRARGVGASRALVASCHPGCQESRRKSRRPILHVALLLGCVALGAPFGWIGAACVVSVVLALIIRGAARRWQAGLDPLGACMASIHAQFVKLPMAIGVLGTRLAR